MKPAQIAALAKVMSTHGLTRLTVGSVTIERPPPAPVLEAVEDDAAEEKKRARSHGRALDRMRDSQAYKAYVRGAPLMVE